MVFAAGLSVCTNTISLALSVIRHPQPLKLALQPIAHTARFLQVEPLARSVFARFRLVNLALFFEAAFVRTYIAHKGRFLVYSNVVTK